MSAPTTRRPDDASAIFDGAFRIVLVLSAVLAVLTAARLVLGDGGPASPAAVPGGAPTASAASPSTTPAPGEPVDVTAYLVPDARPAPPLELAGPAGTQSLAALRGQLVLVFFGYTHCPDVCPATIGTVGSAIDAYGRGAQAIFVSVDPERDTPDWLAEFARYMPTGFSPVSGSPSQVRAAADAWGVRYARVETDEPGVYLMSHTADVFVVDRAGQLRATFPFGTEAETMVAVLEAIDVEPAPATAPPAAVTPSPVTASPTPTPAPVAELHPLLVSSSMWAGGNAPLIFTLDDDTPAALEAELAGPDGTPVGPPVPAVPVRPVGIEQVSYVAELDVPAAGSWQVVVRSTDGGARGAFAITALDPGGTAPLGRPAPDARTATAAEVDALTWLTTDPLPDQRLYATSTGDARSAGTPFVFVVDSYSFKITPQCGQAVVLAKQLLDRWPTVPFIHHEPYRYTVVTTEPVLEGTPGDPQLTDVAEAWGVGQGTWGVESMPWIFVVDGDGVVRAKYQGIIGSADVDVMLTLLNSEQEMAVWPGQNGPGVPSLRAPTTGTVRG